MAIALNSPLRRHTPSGCNPRPAICGESRPVPEEERSTKLPSVPDRAPTATDFGPAAGPAPRTQASPRGGENQARKTNLPFFSRELSFPYKVSLQTGKPRLRDGLLRPGRTTFVVFLPRTILSSLRLASARRGASCRRRADRRTGFALVMCTFVSYFRRFVKARANRLSRPKPACQRHPSCAECRRNPLPFNGL